LTNENSFSVAAPTPTTFELESVPERTPLEPGEYLMRIAFARPVDRETLEDGLARMGWSRVAIDESVKTIEPTVPVVFVATLSRPILLVNTGTVYWGDHRRLESAPFEELRYQLVPFPLEEGKRYEIQFLTRMKAHPTKERVVEVLRAMRGFEVEELTALRKDMRIPGHPGTSATLWFAVARWFGPHSHVNMDDPVCFEEVRETADQPDEEDEGRESRVKRSEEGEPRS
jgi:hypothetical protein